MSFLDSLDDVSDALSRKSSARSVEKIALTRIRSDPNQPRKAFDQKALEELAQSIKERGVLQPITLRTLDAGKTYVIRFGERRFRASVIAGLADIPAIVTEDEADENERLDQVIENDQRADISTIEMAEAVNQMVADGLSKETISKRLGRSRTAVSMYAAVSEFPEELAGDFLSRSPLRAAYDLFVAWKTAPDQVLAFVAERQDGVTAAEASAFGRSLKGAGGQSQEKGPAEEEGDGEPLHVQRPEAPAIEREEEEPALELSGGEDEREAEKPARTTAAPKSRRDAKPVFIQVYVAGRAAKVRLPDMVEVAFDDGELATIPASKIDPS